MVTLFDGHEIVHGALMTRQLDAFVAHLSKMYRINGALVINVVDIVPNHEVRGQDVRIWHGGDGGGLGIPFDWQNVS